MFQFLSNKAANLLGGEDGDQLQGGDAGGRRHVQKSFLKLPDHLVSEEIACLASTLDIEPGPEKGPQGKQGTYQLFPALESVTYYLLCLPDMASDRSRAKSNTRIARRVLPRTGISCTSCARHRQEQENGALMYKGRRTGR